MAKESGSGVSLHVRVGFVPTAPRRRTEKLHGRGRPETRRVLLETGGREEGGIP